MLGTDTTGDNGRDIKRKRPIRTEKNPNIAPMILFPKKLNATDSSPMSKLANNMNDTNNANVAIFLKNLWKNSNYLSIFASERTEIDTFPWFFNENMIFSTNILEQNIKNRVKKNICAILLLKKSYICLNISRITFFTYTQYSAPKSTLWRFFCVPTTTTFFLIYIRSILWVH